METTGRKGEHSCGGIEEGRKESGKDHQGGEKWGSAEIGASQKSLYSNHYRSFSDSTEISSFPQQLEAKGASPLPTGRGFYPCALCLESGP